MKRHTQKILKQNVDKPILRIQECIQIHHTQTGLTPGIKGQFNLRKSIHHININRLKEKSFGGSN